MVLGVVEIYTSIRIDQKNKEIENTYILLICILYKMVVENTASYILILGLHIALIKGKYRIIPFVGGKTPLG